MFIICQLKLITGWFFYKFHRPQIATELIIALRSYRSQDLDFSELELQSVSVSDQHSRINQTDNENAPVNGSIQQSGS